MNEQDNALKISIRDGEIRTSDPVTIITPDGKQIIVSNDFGKWVVMIR